ncbi:hypothetical protein BGZ65_003313 [Modicella reniformis]|uniref:Uncharacterized protein n=1 Tax=Modicella reniformis TaxID=1440133 RepID=A0A9P6J6D4_9FUNG|nr:hypothetical protein BGZ65_003313 [Modicella reniformis]
MNSSPPHLVNHHHVEPSKPNPEPLYQAFQAANHPHPIQIPAVRHPATGILYVIWTDITDCFPRAMRVQHGDIYVPFVRDKDLSRVRPHGIRYHPGIVLEVIYNDPLCSYQQQQQQQQQQQGIDKQGLRSINNNRHHTDIDMHHPPGHKHSHGHGHGHSQSQSRSQNRSHRSLTGSATLPSTSHHKSLWSADPKVGTSVNEDESEDEYKDENENDDEDRDGDEDGDGDEDEVNNKSDIEDMDRSRIKSGNANGQDPFADAIVLFLETELPKWQDHGRHEDPAAQQNNDKEKKEDRDNDHMDKDIGEESSPRTDKHSKVIDASREEEGSIQEDDSNREEKEESFGIGSDNDIIATPTTTTSIGHRKDNTIVANKDTSSRQDNSNRDRKSAIEPRNTAVAENQATRGISEDYEQTLRRLELSPTDPTPHSTAVTKPNRLPEGQFNSLTNADIVQRRVEQVLRKRYRWIESYAPKLFVFLPANCTTSTKTEADFDTTFVSSLNWTDFAVHFLCDCGSIQGFGGQRNPHWTLKERPLGHPVTNSTEKSMVEKFGSYMVCILEMFRYGIDLDFNLNDTNVSDSNNHRRIIIPAETDPELLKRIELAIRYLKHKGARSSDDFLDIVAPYEPESLALECVLPSLPLSKANMVMMKSLFFSDSRRTIDDTHPYLTVDRDVRWICLRHYAEMSPQAAWTAALKFSSDAASTTIEFRICMGAFRAVVTTREHARDFYRLGEQLTSTCVFRLFLDWNLTLEDEEELRVAVSKFPAVCVRIQVRSASLYTGNVAGFGHGYSAIIFEAIKNTKIEAFVMDQGPKDDPTFYGYDERYDVKRSFSAQDALVRFKRSTKKDKMNLRILVTDIDRGILKIRKVFEGLHHFTKLSLVISDIWEYVTIAFLKPSMPGYEIEDTEYLDNRPLMFFEKRGNMDSITYNCRVMGDNQFLQSKALTSMSLGFIFVRDRNKVREVLKNNKRLQKIELENLAQDDPSQIYESFKALLVNHPTLEKIEVKQRHTRSSSDFVWRDVSDPAKMNLVITMYEGDKVASMFQKYATSLRRIDICGISVQDAAVLEKVLRPKKGPFKLRSISMVDVHLYEAAALEDLKKIITRGDFEETRVFGDVSKIKSDREIDADRADSIANSGGNHTITDKNNNHKGSRAKLSEKGKQKMEEEAAVKMMDFVISISAKITGLCVWSVNGSHRMLDALEKKRPYSPILPMLTLFSASGLNKRILDYKWLAEMLFYKSASTRQLMNAYATVSGSGGGHHSSGSSNNNSHNNHLHNNKDLSTITAVLDEHTKDMNIPSLRHFTVIALDVSPSKVAPLDDLSLQDFEVKSEDWTFLVKVLDFSKLRTFRLDLVSEISGEMLNMLVDVIPEGAPLEAFSVSVPGPTPEDSLLCQQRIKKKVEGGTTGAGEKEKHVAVLVNGIIG